MKSVPKLLVIAILVQFHLSCDANGNSSNVGSYGVIAKLGKDAKFAQQFENGPSNPDEKLINDKGNLEVGIHFQNFFENSFYGIYSLSLCSLILN